MVIDNRYVLLAQSLSLECISHIECQFSNTLADVIQCSVFIFLLEEEFGIDCINNKFYGGNVQNTVVQELVQSVHMMVEE